MKYLLNGILLFSGMAFANEALIHKLDKKVNNLEALSTRHYNNSIRYQQKSVNLDKKAARIVAGRSRELGEHELLKGIRTVVKSRKKATQYMDKASSNADKAQETMLQAIKVQDKVIDLHIEHGLPGIDAHQRKRQDMDMAEFMTSSLSENIERRSVTPGQTSIRQTGRGTYHEVDNDPYDSEEEASLRRARYSSSENGSVRSSSPDLTPPAYVSDELPAYSK